MPVDINLLDELSARGLIHDTTDIGALKLRLAEGPVKVYVGFDPTADSLHVGNLVGLLMLRRFQEAGHVPVVLAGGATGMIGDPSGKSAERNLLDDAGLNRNLDGVVPQLRRFLDFEAAGNPAELLDNRSWTLGVSYLEFLRDVGKHVTINHMVAKESVRSRMVDTHDRSQGISYTEFSYMLLQAHDFYQLRAGHNCEMQMGGSDQWGNITLGADLIRRKSQSSAFGLTWPLLLKPDGTKYGKTAGGDTIWLGAHRMSPYRFYQAWLQVADSEIHKLLSWLTFLSVDEIAEVVASHEQEPHRRHGQKRLAEELTRIVHGAETAEAAIRASGALFGSTRVEDLTEPVLEVLTQEVPTVHVERAKLDTDNNLTGILADAEIVTSKSEAHRLIKQNGISINAVKVTADWVVGKDNLLFNKFCFVRRGKKNVYLLVFEQ